MLHSKPESANHFHADTCFCCLYCSHCALNISSAAGAYLSKVLHKITERRALRTAARTPNCARNIRNNSRLRTVGSRVTVMQLCAEQECVGVTCSSQSLALMSGFHSDCGPANSVRNPCCNVKMRTQTQLHKDTFAHSTSTDGSSRRRLQDAALLRDSRQKGEARQSVCDALESERCAWQQGGDGTGCPCLPAFHT